jgi:hypothetical protein
MFHNLCVLLLDVLAVPFFFLCVSLAQNGQGPPFSATWILHNLKFGDGRTWFYFVFGLGKLTFRSGPAPDVGLKKPWAEPCRSRPLPACRNSQ